MKPVLIASLALAALAAGALPAQACNPQMSHNFGKVVAPTRLPAAMLARNSARASAAAQAGSIVGLWHDVHTASDGSLFLEGYDSWNATGTENELGNLPPATGPLCVGVWTHTGRSVDLTTHVAWLYDTSNNFQGTLNMTEKNRVAADGNTYTGTFEAHFYDPTGAQFLDVTGTTTAERLVQ